MVHEYDVPPAAILEKGDDEIQSRPKRTKKKRKDSVLKLRLDPEMLRGKSGDELNKIVEQEKVRLSYCEGDSGVSR